MTTIVEIAAVLGIFVALPLFLFLSAWHYHRTKDQPSKSTVAMGNALNELDRILTRPSVEYRVEVENEDKLSEDEKGGD